MDTPTLEHRVVAGLLRLLGPKAATDFLDSDEFRSLPQVERDRLYAADAELEERQRRHPRATA